MAVTSSHSFEKPVTWSVSNCKSCAAMHTMQVAKRQRGEDWLEDNEGGSQITDGREPPHVLHSCNSPDAGRHGKGYAGPVMNIAVRDGGRIKLSRSEVDMCALLKRLDDDFLCSDEQSANIPFLEREVQSWRQGVRQGIETLSTFDLVCALQVS